MTNDKTQCAEERAELAAQEELLLASLVACGPTPPSVEPSQLEAAAASLLRKRMRGILQGHPELKDDCGDDLAALTHEYAKFYPGSHPEGICADAARLKRFLVKKKSKSAVNNLFTALTPWKAAFRALKGR